MSLLAMKSMVKGYEKMRIYGELAGGRIKQVHVNYGYVDHYYLMHYKQNIFGSWFEGRITIEKFYHKGYPITESLAIFLIDRFYG